MTNHAAHCAHAALQWYLGHGVDEALAEEPVNRLAPQAPPAAIDGTPSAATTAAPPVPSVMPSASMDAPPPRSIDKQKEAKDAAAKATTLEELRETIQSFEGNALKKTATHCVFAGGNPKANIMLIGDAPAAEEDREGKPFLGESGQLLDKIFQCIQINRDAQTPEDSLYLANILNWRPPGNRTPTQQEIDASLPFIEKHIALAQPKIIVLCGALTAKSLLRTGDSISKLRGKAHDYTPQTLMEQGETIPAIVTYHPEYLLRTPAQKRAVWQDMLMLKDRVEKL